MSTILVIEDESSILLGLEDALSLEKHDVLTARNGELGLKFALQENIDLIILDIMLPRMSGFEVLEQYRQHNKTTPVVLLTAKGQEKDKVLGFNLGADDYVTKPFSIRELLARIRAILKRSMNTDMDLTEYELGGIRFDFKGMKAFKGRKPVEFSPREFELLRFLIARRGEVVSRSQILQTIWQYDIDNTPTTRTIDNYIVKLRHKIEKCPNQPEHILTIHGKGYRFED